MAMETGELGCDKNQMDYLAQTFHGKTKTMRCLITGSCGFLGRHLVRELEILGHKVFDFDLRTGHNVDDTAQLAKCLDGMDVCYHLAAVADLYEAEKDPLAAMNGNILGTVKVAHACWAEKAMLNYISTCCVYGSQTSFPVTEKRIPAPTEIYAWTKLVGEDCVRAYGTVGLKYNILRSATLYGPGMRASLAPRRFLELAAANKPLEIHGNGEQTRALTYVTDVAKGMAMLTDIGGVNNEIFNIVGEESVSVLKMADIARKLTNSKSDMIFVPDRKGQIHHQGFDNSKMRALGWKPEVSFEEGMKRTWEWIKTLKKHEHN